MGINANVHGLFFSKWKIQNGQEKGFCI